MDMHNILIVKPSALGDVIQTTCVLPLIKNHFPQAKISWFVFSQNQDIVVDHPLIDAVFSLPRHKSSFKAKLQLIKQLRQAKFDTVIDFQGLLRSALIAFLSGTKRRIGFANAREMAPLFYTEKYDVPTSMHAVDRYLALCTKLGMPKPQQVTFPLPVKTIHRDHIQHILNSIAATKVLIIICLTARWASKCWPEAHFVTLANKLQQQLNAKIILVGAPNEAAIIQRIAKAIPDSTNLCGKLKLMEVAALLERSDLFVGNDSALMHMAAATKTKTVAIFGPTDPQKTGPYNPLAKVVKTDMPCMPCYKNTCGTMECMRQLAPETVLAACLEIIDFD